MTTGNIMNIYRKRMVKKADQPGGRDFMMQPRVGMLRALNRVRFRSQPKRSEMGTAHAGARSMIKFADVN
jgi:hypothetical protein